VNFTGEQEKRATGGEDRWLGGWEAEARFG